MPIKKNSELLAVGLMSGTSLDGIDVAFLKSDGVRIERVGTPFHMAYNDEQKSQLQRALFEAKQEKRPTHTNLFINGLEDILTDLHHKAVIKALSLNNIEKTDIDVVGFHGQTLLHGPDEGWSWQIGSGRKLANDLNIKVVNDFRRYDVENGGQGAPFVPIYHHALLSSYETDYPIAVLNIGGVANLTWISGEEAASLVAFDTGPGNALLDDWIRKKSEFPCDKDGFFSKKGVVDNELIHLWMKDHFFKKLPPKSLDRNAFDVSSIEKLSIEDGAATLCAFTVKTIKEAEALCPQIVKNWFVCGGGANNPTLMEMLSDNLAGTVNKVSDIGFDGDFTEAEAFAYLAVRKLYDLPITFPGTTGIKAPSPGGVIHIPE